MPPVGIPPTPGDLKDSEDKWRKLACKKQPRGTKDSVSFPKPLGSEDRRKAQPEAYRENDGQKMRSKNVKRR